MIFTTVTGTDAVLTEVTQRGEEAHVKMVRVIRSLGDQLADYIKTRKLSGTPLRAISGRLRDSVTSTVTDDGERVTATVGPVNVPYAAYHEYGFHGVENVRAHSRRVNQVFGRAWNGIVNVRAHTRLVNYAGRPYMRPALEEFRPIIEETIAREFR